MHAEGLASVDDLEIYYEIHGEGRPLVLLHGALSTIETSFGVVLPSLAKNRQIVAVEQQAHGHTPDIDRPLTYEQMAEDTIGLLVELGSDGRGLSRRAYCRRVIDRRWRNIMSGPR
jgi:pimeloyl-ACP methyl ester carboxylesterase